MNHNELDALIAERENEAFAAFRERTRNELDALTRIAPTASNVVRSIFLAGYRGGFVDGLKGIAR